MCEQWCNKSPPQAPHKPVWQGIAPRLPIPGEPGAFGAVRKHDIHTGVDIYCDDEAYVFAAEEGHVVALEKFTGEHAGSPWWRNTWALLIEGESGVIVYGEIVPRWHIARPGMYIGHGELIGQVKRVLKEDKGVTPTSMLHLELLKPGSKETGWWHHGEPQPDYILDPTELVRKCYAQS